MPLMASFWVSMLLAGVPDCTCPKDVPSAREALRAADWVFLGKVMDRQDVTQFWPGTKIRRRGRHFPVTVLRTWKDRRPQWVIARPTAAVTTFDDCPAPVKVGKEYVFFADISGSVYRCVPPLLAKEAVAAIKDLDEESDPAAGSGEGR